MDSPLDIQDEYAHEVSLFNLTVGGLSNCRSKIFPDFSPALSAAIHDWSLMM